LTTPLLLLCWAAMIVPPAGWRQSFGANLLVLRPPDGGGRIRYYERLRPPRRLDAVLAYCLERDREYRLERVERPRRLITSEGEYAACLAATLRQADGAAARRWVGAVFSDEFVAVVDALAIRPASFDLFERTSAELLEGVSLGLGVRRRRFLYAPPPGWQALPSGLVANWYPPDFPGNLTNIVVYPANPVDTAPQAIFEQVLEGEQQAGLRLEGPVSSQPFAASGGLGGLYFELAAQRGGRSFRRHMVVLAGGPYRYSMRLECFVPGRMEEQRSLFRALALSVERLPLAGERFVPPDSRSSAASALAALVD
jgi:hypothetical protein